MVGRGNAFASERKSRRSYGHSIEPDGRLTEHPLTDITPREK